MRFSVEVPDALARQLHLDGAMGSVARSKSWPRTMLCDGRGAPRRPAPFHTARFEDGTPAAARIEKSDACRRRESRLYTQGEHAGATAERIGWRRHSRVRRIPPSQKAAARSE